MSPRDRRPLPGSLPEPLHGRHRLASHPGAPRVNTHPVYYRARWARTRVVVIAVAGLVWLVVMVVLVVAG